MVSQLGERVRLPGGRVHWLSGEERKDGALYVEGANRLREFRLEAGLPVWIFEIDGYIAREAAAAAPLSEHRARDLHAAARRRPGAARPVARCSTPARTKRPWITRCRTRRRSLRASSQIEVRFAPEIPPLRLQLARARPARLRSTRMTVQHLHYRLEESRGYQASGDAWSPGYFRVDLIEGQSVDGRSRPPRASRR